MFLVYFSWVFAWMDHIAGMTYVLFQLSGSSAFDDQHCKGCCCSTSQPYPSLPTNNKLVNSTFAGRIISAFMTAVIMLSTARSPATETGAIRSIEFAHVACRSGALIPEHICAASEPQRMCEDPTSRAWCEPAYTYSVSTKCTSCRHASMYIFICI